MSKYKLVVFGASAGGVSAFQSILSKLPSDFKAPIVVVHHLPSQSKIDVNLVYGTKTKLRVEQLEDKQPLLPGTVYFAPPDYHLLIERDLTASFDVSEPVNFSRPSIDVTFLSVADSLGKDAFAVLLTGANSDGANGISELHARGAMTLIQDPKTAESPRMPESALSLSPKSRVAPLDAIPGILIDAIGGQ